MYHALLMCVVKCITDFGHEQQSLPRRQLGMGCIRRDRRAADQLHRKERLWSEIRVGSPRFIDLRDAGML